MQAVNSHYTSREEVEELLRQTLDAGDRKSDTTKDGKKVSRKAKIIRRSIYGLLILIMLALLAKVWHQKLNNETPSLFGYQLYVVETGSMIPTIPIGSNILVRQLRDNDALSVGDIVTYSRGNSAVTHRIVELVTGEDGILRYQTKGDNPDNALDPWLVERADIRGVVIWHFSLSSLFGK